MQYFKLKLCGVVYSNCCCARDCRLGSNSYHQNEKTETHLTREEAHSKFIVTKLFNLFIF